MPDIRSPLTRTIGIAALTAVIVSTLSVWATIAWLTPVSTIDTKSANEPSVDYAATTSRDDAVVSVVETVEPAVVSVVIAKDVPVIERYFDRDDFFFSQIPQLRQNGTQRREVGGGTAFFIRSDGLLMTNKHVVDDPDAEYTVFLNDGRTLPATVVARDPGNDIALLKVEGKDFPSLSIAPVDEPKLGQTVIAIGNALAEFRNTVSVGVISGLQRSIVAGGLMGGGVEQLNRIVQTDAAVNEGNSGGPLIDLQGNVVGMNTAVAGGGAQNIAFAIPAGDLSRAIKGYEEHGRILRPYLGVRYGVLSEEERTNRKISYDYGILIVPGEGPDEPAIFPDSPADKANLEEGDLILEVDGQKLTQQVSLQSIVQQKQPGDSLKLRIFQDGKEKDITVILEEWKEEESRNG